MREEKAVREEAETTMCAVDRLEAWSSTGLVPSISYLFHNALQSMGTVQETAHRISKNRTIISDFKIGFRKFGGYDIAILIPTTLTKFTIWAPFIL